MAPLPVMPGFGRWLFKYRNRVFPLVLGGLFVVLRPRLWGDSLRTDLWLDTAGLAVAIAGQWLRAIVVGYAYIKRGGLNKQVHADKLVTAGLFAHSRNPLYLGNVLILAGLFMIFNHPIAYLVGGLFFGLGYLAIVQTEEAFLTAKFGVEYQQYCARVHRWWPRFAGLSATLGGMEFAWRRVLDKEFSSCIVWWLTALALIADEALASEAGLSDARAQILTVAAVTSAAAFLLARTAKKQGWLTRPST